MACDLAQPGKHAASPGRNESPDDDVLLEALQHVGLTEDSSVGEHSGGLLEGGRRDEGAGLQAGLGDAEQHRLPGRRLAALRRDRGVGVLEVEPGSSTSVFCSICRTITSICLSLMVTPCSR